MDEDLCENMIDKKFELRNNRFIKKMINDDELKKISIIQNNWKEGFSKTG